MAAPHDRPGDEPTRTIAHSPWIVPGAILAGALSISAALIIGLRSRPSTTNITVNPASTISEAQRVRWEEETWRSARSLGGEPSEFQGGGAAADCWCVFDGSSPGLCEKIENTDCHDPDCDHCPNPGTQHGVPGAKCRGFSSNALPHDGVLVCGKGPPAKLRLGPKVGPPAKRSNVQL